jgi:hypothetical protein
VHHKNASFLIAMTVGGIEISYSNDVQSPNAAGPISSSHQDAQPSSWRNQQMRGYDNIT